jgi:hypothetical protein
LKPTIFNNISSAPPILVADRVRYLITQNLAWFWHLSRVSRGGCVAALAIAGVFLVTGCTPFPPWDDGKPDSTPPTRIALIDISASTEEALSAYKEQFEKDTREFALKQGTLDVILFADDPLAESQIERFTFSTKDTGDYAKADLVQQADATNKKVEELMDNPQIKNLNSTALLRSFLLADREAGQTKGPLDVVVYSDGVENSKDISMLDSKQLDDATINSTLDRLEADGLLPVNLNGVPISFPFGGFHPGGWQGQEEQVDPVKVEHFWQAWAQRAEAKLTWDIPPSQGEGTDDQLQLS